MSEQTTELPHLPTDEEMLQDCVRDFSRKLEQMLKANGRGVSWREMRWTWLLMRLRQEVEELAEAMSTGQDVRKECFDVAAFAIMIWDQSQR